MHLSKMRLLLAVALFHVAIIGASNYLVQLPFTIFGFHTTWGAFSFPLIFLATDLTVRLFGAQLARQIVLLAMLPALVVSYLLTCVFYEGNFVGLAGLGEWQPLLVRIAFASFLAYLVGQMLDVQVFNRLRQAPQWWLAPLASTFLGNTIDTLVFFSVAFYQAPDAFMAQHWPEIAIVDLLFKIGINLLFFLPGYGVLVRVLTHKMAQLQAKQKLDPQLTPC